ncbi:hexaprenyl pyrophosphate synthetase mitochondrial precursor [Nadsonia fulvescens var. elongata DSM 6958]|uniref:Hexaprenyl pyrophosphate synthetase mitochondrial n=1 Tax=Nadsonia fulvescens var. elongata DSM 6958 TaxID=857566 RepID=A0A1E3PNX7_9ASCO|nr:hexaprenyl pyrophosphate synthetase mitochondrial precursor [Nadsonia fulvescens var. elongata DSM 6958]
MHNSRPSMNLRSIGSLAAKRVFQSQTRSKITLSQAVAAAQKTDCNGNQTPNEFSTAVKKAAKLVDPNPNRSPKDPFVIVSKEMANLAKNIAGLIGSGHPTLNKVAAYYFGSEGKHVRPLIVLLISKALSEIPTEKRDRLVVDYLDMAETSFPTAPLPSPTTPMTPLQILHEVNPNLVLNPISRLPKPFTSDITGILPKQRRLADIVEMIHTASLLHDDVIDISDTRRGKPTGNIEFGNKMSVLGGDFLLGRASVGLARLRNPEVMELVSTSIANLVEGEFMQLKNTALDNSEASNQATFQYYIQKTYLKTASLMSKSCRAAAILSGARQDVIDSSYEFGKNLGLCFQVVDDMLDYTVNDSELGKPSGADLKLGLATAPVLFAWEKHPELGSMIKRKFDLPGDVERARELVRQSNGLEKTRELAQSYCDKALEHLYILPDSEARRALESLTRSVVDRKK